MVRKHTRRAAKAAFAIALGVPLLLGGTATASHQAAAKKPTVIVGTKNFPEQFILGQLYKQALQAKGFKVGYKENIGSSELIDTALTSGKINFYPEYTGVIVQVLAHKTSPTTAQATYLAAKRFEETQALQCAAVVANYTILDAGTIARIHAAGMRALCYTVNDPYTVRWLVGCAIDGIITDAVDRFSPHDGAVVD